MEAMLEIFLYSYLYLMLAKCCLSYYLLFSLQQKLEKRAEQILSGSEGSRGEREGM
jgi:hypothetical protein